MDITRTKTIRNDNGERVVVTLTISTIRKETLGTQPAAFPTTDHETIVDPLRVSFTGDVYAKHSRYPYACGQVQESLPEPHPIRAAWKRYHLNDMRSHCIHQPRSIKWDESAPCPHTGYRAGSAWLVEPVPADELTRILALFD